MTVRAWFVVLLIAASAAFALAGCAVAPTSQPPTNLGVANNTAVTLTLFVNGNRIGDIAPGGTDPGVDSGSLPPLPWVVKAQAPSGLVLGTMLTGASSGTSTSTSTESAVFDLACGTIIMWTGSSQPANPAGQSPAGSAPPLPACGP